MSQAQHLALVDELIDRICNVDHEADQEHRWYEVWNPILNYVVSVSSAPGELSVAPQYRHSREALKCMFSIFYSTYLQFYSRSV